jgi:hypothetical protein
MQKYNVINSPTITQQCYDTFTIAVIIITIIIPVLCYIVKHFFYSPPVLVVWWHTTSHIEPFALTGIGYEAGRILELVSAL